MKPVTVFTLNELQRIVPSFKKEAVTSENPKVQQAVQKLFYRLGCDCTDGIEVQEGVLTKNRFGELDVSPRFIVAERTDRDWLQSGHASSEAKQYTTDYTLLATLGQMSQQITSI